MYQCHIVYTERCLQQCHLVELVQYYAGVGVTLHVDDDTHAFTVRLIIGVGNALYSLFVGQIGNRFD